MVNIIVAFLFAFVCGSAYATQVPTGQSVGSTIQKYTFEKKQKKVIKQLTTPEVQPPSLYAEEIEVLPRRAQSLYIKKILLQQDPTVRGVVKEDALVALTEASEDMELSLKDMKRLAATITQKIGVQEVRAYIPQQSFEAGTMYINIIYQHSLE